MNWLNVHDSEGWHPSDSSFEIEDDKREIVASLNIIFTHLTRESRETIASKPISMKFLFRFAIRRSAFNIDRLVKYLRSILETLAQTASHSPETRLILISPFSVTLVPLSLYIRNEENSKVTLNIHYT